MRQKGFASILLLALFVGVVVIVGTVLVKNSNQPLDLNSIMKKESTSVQNDNEAAQSGSYVAYSDTVLSSVGKRRVLFFYANWCPTCRPADASFEENKSKIPQDVLVIRVNYNDSETDSAEKALAQKYNVTYQHTYVQIDENGNEVTKWNGGDIDELLKNIK